jgi:hypothetical protein
MFIAVASCVVSLRLLLVLLGSPGPDGVASLPSSGWIVSSDDARGCCPDLLGLGEEDILYGITVCRRSSA